MSCWGSVHPSDAIVQDGGCGYINSCLIYVSGIVVVGINRPKAKNSISKNLVKLVCVLLIGHSQTLLFGWGFFCV